MDRRSTIAGAAPPLLVWIDGAPLEGLELLSASVLQALDRPDRLEASFLAPAAAGADDAGARGEAGAAGESASAARWQRRGAVAAAALLGRRLFEGRVDRVGWGFDAALGRHLSLVAYAHYHYLRAARPRERYYQVTDAELAGRIASELELVAVVDPESEVHAWVDREGDPLHFLRGRARRAGRHFGVSGGKLFFTRAVPPPPDATAVIGPLDLVALEVWAGGAGGRGGKLEAAGDADWQPLRQFQLRGAGEMDGGYRAVRCAHVLDGSGCRTVVEFLEEGLDLDAWRRGGAA